MSEHWKRELREFFHGRADAVPAEGATLADLCHVSGRDPRLWADERLYADMMDSIREQLGLSEAHSLLEVGCAAGFLAKGLAERVGAYTGVDVAPSAVKAARRLGLANAEFRRADGTDLPWPEGRFDRALSYDVFTNFPTFDIAAAVTRDMVRVTRPGGRVMVGSLADDERQEEYAEVVRRVSGELEERLGPRPEAPVARGLRARLGEWYRRRVLRVEPKIVCFHFRRGDFLDLGAEMGVETEIRETHEKNPYHGFRFNGVYHKPESP